MPAGCGNFGAHLAFVMKILASQMLANGGFDIKYTHIKYGYLKLKPAVALWLGFTVGVGFPVIFVASLYSMALLHGAGGCWRLLALSRGTAGALSRQALSQQCLSMAEGYLVCSSLSATPV